MRSPRRTRDARHASELRIYRQTPAKRFWNFFSIFVSVQFENSANLRHRKESQEKRNKDTYIVTYLLSFFLTYLRLAFGQAYEEEEEWQRVERTTERGGGGGGERLKKNRNELRSSSEGTRGRARRRRHRRHVGQKSLPPRCRAPREIRPAIVYIEIRSCRNARKWLLARKYLECHTSPSN